MRICRDKKLLHAEWTHRRLYRIRKHKMTRKFHIFIWCNWNICVFKIYIPREKTKEIVVLISDVKTFIGEPACYANNGNTDHCDSSFWKMVNTGSVKNIYDILTITNRRLVCYGIILVWKSLYIIYRECVRCNKICRTWNFAYNTE